MAKREALRFEILYGYVPADCLEDSVPPELSWDASSDAWMVTRSWRSTGEPCLGRSLSV